MVKTDDTRVQDNYRREALRDQSQKPLRLGRFGVGAAIAVLGAAIVALVVAVASGFGPLGSDEKATSLDWTLEQELAAIRSNRGLVPVGLQTKEWTLQDELEAIRSNWGIAQITPPTKEWTLQDELEAIRNNGGVQEPAKDQPTTQPNGPR